MEELGEVANPARRQLHRENEYFTVRVRPENELRGSMKPFFVKFGLLRPISFISI